jgi:hypothetical protein
MYTAINQGRVCGGHRQEEANAHEFLESESIVNAPLALKK